MAWEAPGEVRLHLLRLAPLEKVGEEVGGAEALDALHAERVGDAIAQTA